MLSDDWMAEEEERSERISRERELRSVLEIVCGRLADTKDGAVFLRWMMDRCGVFSQEFPADLQHAAWNGGRRAFGLEVLALCAAVKKADILLANHDEGNA